MCVMCESVCVYRYIYECVSIGGSREVEMFKDEGDLSSSASATATTVLQPPNFLLYFSVFPFCLCFAMFVCFFFGDLSFSFCLFSMGKNCKMRVP